MTPEILIDMFTNIAIANDKTSPYANVLFSDTSMNNSYTCPKVDRVIFNGDYTIVWFKDKTKTMVKRSSVDKDDKQTSIVYAIVKRMFGHVDKDGNIDSYGFYSWISKLAKNGFDQQLAEATEKERKAKAKAEHLAKQKAEHEEAVLRRVKRRAEELSIERAANKMLDDANMLYEKNECGCKKSKSSLIVDSNSLAKTKTTSTYVKPNKKFKDFTPEEKRAYWRYHNKNRNH